MSLGFKNNDPAQTGFQLLEDLSTGYWYSQVLFTALELELFRYLENGVSTALDLASAADCKPKELVRLLKAMERIGLVTEQNKNYCNSQLASLFLVPDKKDFMGDFFLYRQYMHPQWEGLTQKVSA
ncbi:MAG: metal-binding protein, partial [Desulfobacteraceae bacterium]|nr:metal-binding protein [Desulfobacteraceae bacterium]